jgi:translation initiation factor IF-3
VRVIGADGAQAGVMTRAEALQLAQAALLDLVEVSPTAEPPVVRVMDFGKFLFEQNKKAHSAKRKQKQQQVKEVKFRPGTEEADYQVKLRNLTRFLSEGDKAKVTLRFRGREMVHQDIGRKLLDRVQTDLAAAAIVELLNGRAPTPVQILNTCYSFVSEKEAIRVSSVHAWDDKDQTLKAVPGSGGLSPARSEAEGTYAWDWARTIWADSLG